MLLQTASKDGIRGRCQYERPTMKVMASIQTNGKLARLSPEELAEMTRPPRFTTPTAKRAALKRATEGLRVKVRVTPEMYGRR